MSRSYLALLPCVAVIAGCGSGGQVTVITVHAPAANAAVTTTQAPATTTAASTSTYPLVHWNTGGGWPVTLQIIGIRLDPYGYQGCCGTPPPGHDYLMVRTNITVTGRSTEAPSLLMQCFWPGSPSYNPDENDGYESPIGSTQLVLSAYISLNPGQTQVWGAEWEVPQTLNTARVSCEINSGGNDELPLT